MHDIKLWVAALLFMVTFAAGLAVTVLQNKEKQHIFIMTYIDLFGRGLILGAAAFHFLPDGMMNLSEYFDLHVFEICVLLALAAIMALCAFKTYTFIRYVPNFKLMDPAPGALSVVHDQKLAMSKPVQLALHASPHACQLKEKGNTYVPLLLLLVLSSHALSEGLVLGTDLSLMRFSSIALAILLHKTSEALALSCIVYASVRSMREQTGILFCFALMTPLGIVFGVNLNAAHMEFNQFWDGCFDVLATLLFVYIVFNCRSSCRFGAELFKRLSAKISFFSGLLIMAVLSFLIPAV